MSFDLQSVNTYSHSRINLYYSIEYLNVMKDYRLPAPLVGMLRASKLTGKPIVKTELLATKLHVTLSWGERTGLMVRASDSESGDPGSILGRVGVLFP